MNKRLIIGICILAFSSGLLAAGFMMSSGGSFSYVCKGTSVLFTDTTTSPTGAAIKNRQWFFGNDGPYFSSTDTFSYIFNTLINPYDTISVSLLDSFADNTVAFKTDFLIVVQPPSATLTSDRNNTCPGVNIQFFHFGTAGTSLPGSLIISDSINYGDGTSSPPKPPAPSLPPRTTQSTYSNIGNFTVRLILRDAIGCVGVATKTINIYQKPDVKFTPVGFNACRDTLIFYENRTNNAESFKGKAPAGWEWHFFDSVDKTETVKSNAESTFHTWHLAGPQWVYLVGEDTNGCRDSSVVINVNVDTIETLQILVNDSLYSDDAKISRIICFGESVKVTTRGTNAISYSSSLWATSISGDSIMLYTPKNTMTYTVYGKTPNCPPAGRDFKIEVVQPIEIKLTAEPPKMLRGNKSIIKMKANAVYDSMFWYPDTSVKDFRKDSTSASPEHSQTFYASVFYSFKNHVCFTGDSVRVTIDTSCVVDSLRIPNGFTPNGDLTNDVFYLKAYSVKNIIEMSIYDRWGNRVFHRKDLAPNKESLGWNGKADNNGDELPPGLYVYNISAVCVNDQRLNFTGEIHLLR